MERDTDTEIDMKRPVREGMRERIGLARCESKQVKMHSSVSLASNIVMRGQKSSGRKL